MHPSWAAFSAFIPSKFENVMLKLLYDNSYQIHIKFFSNGLCMTYPADLRIK